MRVQIKSPRALYTCQFLPIKKKGLYVFFNNVGALKSDDLLSQRAVLIIEQCRRQTTVCISSGKLFLPS
jgi:hypothetical protein